VADRGYIRKRLLLLVVLVATAVACGPSGPLEVTTIQTGRSLNSDDSVATHTTRFRPTDTLYVAVLTADRGAGTLEARWSYGGRVIHETTKDVSYYGPAATAFRFQAGDNFPAGEYSVEIRLDGEPVGTRQIRVE
jgi:hypothetical protein